ncbi:MAG: Smr/MutS family protein [Acidobacteria bacterium]|nr:Smr/MutS family protein [Acidobacteriota bacterium]
MSSDDHETPWFPGDDGEDIVRIPLEDSLDLHTFLPHDIPAAVTEYLELCRQQGWREVRLIHGKGTGFQRQRIRQVMDKLDFVESYRDAPPERGHWGATLVRLRPLLPHSPEM